MGAVVAERHTVLAQHAAGWGIDGVADLLGADGGGGDGEAVVEVRVAYERLQDVFRHWAAADVAVAEEQDAGSRVGCLVFGHEMAAKVSAAKVRISCEPSSASVGLFLVSFRKTLGTLRFHGR